MFSAAGKFFCKEWENLNLANQLKSDSILGFFSPLHTHSHAVYRCLHRTLHYHYLFLLFYKFWYFFPRTAIKQVHVEGKCSRSFCSIYVMVYRLKLWEENVPEGPRYIITLSAVSALISITSSAASSCWDTKRKDLCFITVLLPLVSLMATWTSPCCQGSRVTPRLNLQETLHITMFFTIPVFPISALLYLLLLYSLRKWSRHV